MTVRRVVSIPVMSFLFGIGLAWGQPFRAKSIDQEAANRLMTSTGGQAQITINRANGTASFIRLQRSAAEPAQKSAISPGTVRNYDQQSRQFLNQYSTLFGVSDTDRDLKLVREQTDISAGGRHLTYLQYHQGVPVFGGTIKTHFDENGSLHSINAMTVPNIAVDAVPTISSEKAAEIAVNKVNKEQKPKIAAAAIGNGLFFYQDGATRGLDLGTHLVWEIAVDNKADVLEYVFVDAQTGKFVDQITGNQDGLFRRAFDGQNLPMVPPSYPDSPFWVEGQPFPTGTTEADNMISVSKDTYDFYLHAFGRDSFDGAGATMDSIFNRGYDCPNASWNGTFISFCPGFTSADDVIAHEWSHAYTQYTSNLIYQWQSGALNESYSDIWGETVDRINGRATDEPVTRRTAGSCSTFSPDRNVLTVNSPAAIAGDYSVVSAAFVPPLNSTGVSGSVVYASPGLACRTLTNGADVAGKIALVDSGSCSAAAKAQNAEAAGAIGVIVANNVPAGLPDVTADVPPATIPSLGITQADGNAIKAHLANGVTATLHSAAGTDDSIRWLIGEDVGDKPGFGALRDMWNPACYSDPGKVSDTAHYVCDGNVDSGGVHTNSGVPNHGYALVVDGGTYNGQTINGIGFNKAAAIYWRAQSIYLTPTADFSDSADALEQSCADLTGRPINDIVTGAVSTDVINSNDCQQVHKAMLAVEMRDDPAQCGFGPLLAQNPPDRCGTGETEVNLFSDGFESGNAGWTISHEGVFPSFVERDWQIVDNLPDGHTGHALLGANPDIGSCTPSDNQAGVLHVDSPPIVVPASAVAPLLTFDHYVATERGFDGGNLLVSVDGGPWTLVPSSAFTYNAYNLTLNTLDEESTNPMGGQPAFSGTDDGSNRGSWGRSLVNLSGIANPGQTIRLRYNLGTDGCGGAIGWYVDDVTVYSCMPKTVR